MGGLARSTTARMQPVGGGEERAPGALRDLATGISGEIVSETEGGCTAKNDKRPHNLILHTFSSCQPSSLPSSTFALQCFLEAWTTWASFPVALPLSVVLTS